MKRTASGPCLFCSNQDSKEGENCRRRQLALLLCHRKRGVAPFGLCAPASWHRPDPPPLVQPNFVPTLSLSPQTFGQQQPLSLSLLSTFVRGRVEWLPSVHTPQKTVHSLIVIRCKVLLYEHRKRCVPTPSIE